MARWPPAVLRCARTGPVGSVSGVKESRSLLSHRCCAKNERLWCDATLTESDTIWASFGVVCPPECPPKINQVKRQSTDILQAGASWRRSGVKLRVSSSRRPDFNTLGLNTWASLRESPDSDVCRLHWPNILTSHKLHREACLTACVNVLAGTEPPNPALHVK